MPCWADTCVAAEDTTLAHFDEFGRMVPEVMAWLVLFGDRLQYHAVFLDRARADQYAGGRHGNVIPLVACRQWCYGKPKDAT